MEIITAGISESGKMYWNFWGQRRVPGTEDGLAIVFSFGGLSKKEALQEIDSALKQNGMEWLKPIGTVMGDWVLDFDKMKVSLNSFEVLQSTKWFQGKARITPECEIETAKDAFPGKRVTVRFTVTQEELICESLLNAPPELIPFVECFCKDHPVTRCCAFIMMRFDKTPLHERIVKTIKETCLRYGIEALRADDDGKRYADALLPNVRTYMHGCEFGIAIFERLTEHNFNPNVSLEVGYMMALNKPVCLLKDKTLTSLQSDLVGRLYEEFDTQRPEETIPPVLGKWLKGKGIITV